MLTHLKKLRSTLLLAILFFVQSTAFAQTELLESAINSYLRNKSFYEQSSKVIYRNGDFCIIVNKDKRTYYAGYAIFSEGTPVQLTIGYLFKLGDTKVSEKIAFNLSTNLEKQTSPAKLPPIIGTYYIPHKLLDFSGKLKDVDPWIEGPVANDWDAYITEIRPITYAVEFKTKGRGVITQVFHTAHEGVWQAEYVSRRDNSSYTDGNSFMVSFAADITFNTSFTHRLNNSTKELTLTYKRPSPKIKWLKKSKTPVMPKVEESLEYWAGKIELFSGKSTLFYITNLPDYLVLCKDDCYVFCPKLDPVTKTTDKDAQVVSHDDVDKHLRSLRYKVEVTILP